MTHDPMLPRERCDFSAIVDRPPLKLPGGARLAFWTIVNYEVWDIGRPMPRQVLPAPTGVPLLPDVPHWSWHEYGMRVGAWRFFELYERLGIRPTLAINARTCEDYARVAEEAKRLGWEFMGHAYDQMPIHKVEDQAAMINRSMDILERFTGKRPVGWLGPGLTQTLETPELLVDAGVKYIGDWVYDDEPTVIRTAKGPLVTLPYTVEINDITMMIVQHHESDYLAQAGDRPVRPAVCRGKASRQDHGARDPPLHQRPAAPHQISRSDLRSCRAASRACCTGTAPKFSIGIWPPRAERRAERRPEPRPETATSLVLHSRGDCIIPFDKGREVAALIPDAQFVALDSRNHVLLGGEPAWSQMIAAVEDFLPDAAPQRIVLPLDELTAREREILELVAQGLDNGGIGNRLKISEKTVRNHVSTIMSKLGIASRSQTIVRARDAGFGRAVTPPI